jgi:hypothetical protein
MTDSAPVKTDADGIPLLENAVTPQQLQGAKTGPGADLTDQEQVERLLDHETVQVLLADLAEDLQKLVAWKVEEALKQELEKLVHDATERSMPRLDCRAGPALVRIFHPYGCAIIADPQTKPAECHGKDLRSPQNRTALVPDLGVQRLFQPVRPG